MNCIHQTIDALERIKKAAVRTMEQKEVKDLDYYELNYKKNLLSQTIDNLKEISNELGIKEDK